MKSPKNELVDGISHSILLNIVSCHGDQDSGASLSLTLAGSVKHSRHWISP
jgi:hypothetical protein